MLFWSKRFVFDKLFFTNLNRSSANVYTHSCMGQHGLDPPPWGKLHIGFLKVSSFCWSPQVLNSIQLFFCHLISFFDSNEDNGWRLPVDHISSGHPSCLDMSSELIAVIKKYPWQCMECKTCIICNQPHHEEDMMFCDHCDRGYHTFCVGLGVLPSGTFCWSLLNHKKCISAKYSIRRIPGNLVGANMIYYVKLCLNIQPSVEKYRNRKIWTICRAVTSLFKVFKLKVVHFLVLNTILAVATK